MTYCSGPRVLLERRALGGVEAVDGRDQRDQAARDEVVELAVGGSSRALRQARYLTIGA